MKQGDLEKAKNKTERACIFLTIAFFVWFFTLLGLGITFGVVFSPNRDNDHYDSNNDRLSIS